MTSSDDTTSSDGVEGSGGRRARYLRPLPTLAGKVVVEARYGLVAQRAAAALWDAGLNVTVCSGPSSEVGGRDCPLVTGQRCSLIDGAEAVVYALDPTSPHDAAVLRRTVEERPGLPVVAWLQGEATTVQELAPGIAVVPVGDVQGLRDALAARISVTAPTDPVRGESSGGAANWYWPR